MKTAALLPLKRSFLDRLAAVRSLAYPFFRGIHPRSSLSGPPTEFDGHRPYLPGDDTRWIDWNLYARLEELHVKVFEVEEDVEVLILVDGSLSMTASSGRKYQTAAAAANALFYLAVQTAHPATVGRYAEKMLDSRGPFRHLESYSAVNELLLSPCRGEGTDLRQSLLPLMLKRRRPVTVLALSDGFQREPIGSVVSALSGLPSRRFIFVRIEDPADLTPRLRGRISLRDVEGGAALDLLTDRTLEKQMRHRIKNHFDRLEKSLLRGKAESFVMPVGGSFEDSFIEMLLRAVPETTRVGAP